MLHKTLILSGVLSLLYSSAALAQDDDYDGGSRPARRRPADRAVQHTVGIQVNELFREIFNFNGTGGVPVPGAYPTRNPYLLTYDLLSRRTGLGVRAGIGYAYEQERRNADDSREYAEGTRINARFGLQKAWRLGRKWQAGAGADFVWNHSNYLRNGSRYTPAGSPADTSFLNIRLRGNDLGGGPMVWLRYNLTPRIQLGSEASFYYTGGDFKQFTESGTRYADPSIPDYLQVENTDGERQNAYVSLPVAFFLLVRF